VKQNYFCKKCKRPEDIARAVHQHDNVKVSRQTINEWTKKYSIFLKSGKRDLEVA